MKTKLALVLFSSCVLVSSCGGGECGGTDRLTCDASLKAGTTLTLDDSPITLSKRPGFFWIECSEPDAQSGACLDDAAPNAFLRVRLELDDDTYGVTSESCLHRLEVVLTIPPGSTLTAGAVLSGVTASASFLRVNADSSGCVALQPAGEFSTSSAVVTVLPGTSDSWSFSVEADLVRTSPLDEEAGSLPARVRLGVPDASCFVISSGC